MNYHQKQAPSTSYHSPITNHQALDGENRGIFGLNQDTSDANNGDPARNHDNPDLSKMTYSQYSRILAILAEDVDENEPKPVRFGDPISPFRSPTSPGPRPGHPWPDEIRDTRYEIRNMSNKTNFQKAKK